MSEEFIRKIFGVGKKWRKRIGVEPTDDLSTVHWI